MQFQNFIKPKCNIVILTGAGISAESGLNTFRGSDGLWEGRRVEDVATPEAFIRNPDLVQKFYNERRAGVLDDNIQPNPAHDALARLEKTWFDHNGGTVLLVTQNIDDLHERAGNKYIYHMHGELLKMFCTHCIGDSDAENAQKYEIKQDLSAYMLCPSCGQKGGLRPDIVWFGEMPYHMEDIFGALQDCDLFVSIGTSGNVYPAAGFVKEAHMAGAHTIELNLEKSLTANAFHEGIYGKASEVVPDFVDTLLRISNSTS